MSYLVLARKYRPQTFEEVVGQNPITQALQNAITTKRVAHAYLFAGPRGVGKTSVARILAKALNCAQGPTAHPCNDCPSCREIREGNSIDVMEIDGASNRGIDEIRELRENVKYLPAHNPYKVYIIDEVHMLTDQAFNALLKTLEEPPSHVIFVFATTEPHKIPLTILSRCQRYNFRRIPLEALIGHLKKITRAEKMEISDGSLHLIARQAQGSLRDAQSLLDQVFSFSGEKVADEEVTEVLGVIDRKILFEAIQGLAEGNRAGLLEIVDQVHNYGYDLKEFCEELIRLVRDLLSLKVLPRESQHLKIVDLPEEEVKDLISCGAKLSTEEIHYLFRSLISAYEDIARSSFPRIILDMTLSRVARKRPILSVEEVIDKLKTLEERLGSTLAPSAPHTQEPAYPPPSIPMEEEEENAPAVPVQTAAKPPSYAAAPPLPAPSPALAAPAGEEWKEFVNFAKKKKPPLASLLAQGHPLCLNSELLEIGYLKGSFYLERMQDKDNQPLLEDLCTDFFRRKMKVRISGIEPNAIPRIEGKEPDPEPRKNNNHRREREEEALNHPLVREAINIFGGRVIEIKAN